MVESVSNVAAVIDDEPAAPLSMIPRIDAERATEIAIAKMYPRKVQRVLSEIEDLATIDKDIAAGCFYSVPRAGKRITGPSVRLAEIMASKWGNMRVATRILEEGDTFVVVEGLCHDLETNVGFRCEKRRRITDKHGNRYNDDLITNTVNAAQSIAFRDVVFRVIPKTYVNQIYAAARDVALGKAKSMKERRHNLITHWEENGVTKDKLLQHLGYTKIEEITLEDLEYLLGVWSGIKERDYDVEDVFDKPRNQPEKASIDLRDVKPGEAPKPDEKPADGQQEIPTAESEFDKVDPEVERRRCSKLRSEIRALLSARSIPGDEWDRLCQGVGSDGDIDEMNGGQLEKVKAAVEGIAPAKKR